MEVLCAVLAADLGLPVAEPLLVEVPADWAEVIPDSSRRDIAKKSLPLAFGSRFVGQGYRVWHRGTALVGDMIATAAAIFAFDAVIQNPDRREDNPNCLVRGSDLLIFDHELALPLGPLVGWKPPWTLGGLSHLARPGGHVFREPLRKAEIDFAPIRASWKALSDSHLQSYQDLLPREWVSASSQVAQAIDLLRSARDNFDDCVVELARVLQ